MALQLLAVFDPTEVAAHKGKSSAPEAQYGLKRAYSAHVMSAMNMLVQECSRICLNVFLEKRFFICVISVRQISTLWAAGTLFFRSRVVEEKEQGSRRARNCL